MHEHVDGWVSFCCGQTIEENRQKRGLGGAIMAQWLRKFRAISPLTQWER